MGVGGWVGGCVPLKALFLVSIISNTEINIYFLVYKLKGGLPYNTDCFSYWQGTIQASYAVMRQLLLHFDMSLLLLTVTLRGVSNKHCLLSLFSFADRIVSISFHTSFHIAIKLIFGLHNIVLSLRMLA